MIVYCILQHNDYQTPSQRLILQAFSCHAFFFAFFPASYMCIFMPY